MVICPPPPQHPPDKVLMSLPSLWAQSEPSEAHRAPPPTKATFPRHVEGENQPGREPGKIPPSLSSVSLLCVVDGQEDSVWESPPGPCTGLSDMHVVPVPGSGGQVELGTGGRVLLPLGR